MLTRAIFGAIYVAIIIAGILCGNYAFMGLLLLLSTLGVNEFITMTQGKSQEQTHCKGSSLTTCLDVFGAGLLVITFWVGIRFIPGVICCLLYLVIRLIVQLYLPSQNALRSLARSCMAQLYVALPIALMSFVYALNPKMLLLLFALVWVNDTFAYLCGRALGRHKFWERISPKKTWEGFIGGLLFTMLAGFMCGIYLSNHLNGFGPISLTIVALTASIAGTYGDLIESLLKRTMGVKDSGSLIPGHGGILDRIDSILLVIPSSIVVIFLILSYGAF